MPERLMTLARLKNFYIIAILIVLLLSPVNSARANVILDYLKATPQSDGILLEWETSSEADSSGFYILRSTKLDINYTRLNIFFLSDSEAGEGVYYSYLDDQVIPGINYYYKLEAIDLDGSRDFFGPVSASFLTPIPTWTSTATLTPTNNGLTSAPSSTPARGTTLTPIISPTPTQTGTIFILITQTNTPTPLVTELVPDKPTVTPTLEPLPTFDFLFPAPTSTPIISSTPSPQITSTELGRVSSLRPRPLSTRYIVLLGIVLLLWACLLVFLVLLIRKIFQSAIDLEEVD